ncbi:MAG: diguanylate cyclase, partial [Kangiellaceae bacterium]|nr:diguanylate cyclase [Kangiellaceae bacterium]
RVTGIIAIDKFGFVVSTLAGISLLDEKLNLVKKLSETGIDKDSDFDTLSRNGLASFTVRELTYFNNTIWLGTTNGISRIPVNNFSDFEVENKEPLILSGQNILALQQLDERNLLIGTDKGLDLLTFQGDEYFITNTIGAFKQAIQAITVVEEQVIIGTYEGIYKVDIPNNRVSGLLISVNDTSKHFTENVTDIFSKELAAIWVGTTRGLFKLSRKNKFEYTVEKRSEAFASEAIGSVEMDLKGDIWVSTRRGITKYQPDSHVAYNLTNEDGALTSSYFKQASHYDGTTMFFGGHSGLTYFTPKEIRAYSRPPQMVLTQLKVGEKVVDFNSASKHEVKLGDSILTTSQIELPHSSKNISLEVTPIHIASPYKSRFKYCLQGKENICGEGDSFNRNIDLSRLSPGNYTLLLRGANDASEWSETTSVSVRVIPPWWQMTITHIAAILLLLGLISFYLKLKQKRAYFTERMLQNKLNERTVVLEEKQRKIELIATVCSAILRNSRNYDSSQIEHLLKLVRTYFGIEHIFLSTFKDEGDTMVINYESVAEIECDLSAKNFLLKEEDFRICFKNIRNNKNTIIPRISDKTDSIQLEFLNRKDCKAKSVFIFPLVYRNTVKGSLGLVNYCTDKTWSEQNTTFVKLLGNLLINSIESDKMKRNVIRDEQAQILNGIINKGTEHKELKQKISSYEIDRKEFDLFLDQTVIKAQKEGFHITLLLIEIANYSELRSFFGLDKLLNTRGLLCKNVKHIFPRDNDVLGIFREDVLALILIDMDNAILEERLQKILDEKDINLVPELRRKLILRIGAVTKSAKSIITPSQLIMEANTALYSAKNNKDSDIEILIEMEESAGS